MAAERSDKYNQRREEIRLSNYNPGYEDVAAADFSGPRHRLPGYNESGAAIPLDRRDSDPPAHGRDEDHRQRWVKEAGPRDTAVLLESLPSKQLERMASEVANADDWKKRSGKRKSFHGTVHIPRNKDVSAELLKQVQDNPELADEVEEELKGMTLRMSAKRRLKSQVSIKRKQPKHLTRWKRMKYNLSITWKHFKYDLAEFGYFLKLWEGHLKKIEGHFGTGVLSYFLFLKWLFYINIPILVLTFGFVVLPQILHRTGVQDPAGYKQNVTFTGKELLTGSYWFTDTELYYGYYTNETFSLGKSDSSYNMKYAYLFTCGGYYFLCLIILAISISKSYKKNYIEGSGAFDFYYVSRVFCGWDYGIMAKNSGNLRHKSIYNEMMEYLSGITTEEKILTVAQRCGWFWLRILTNLLILGMIAGAAYLIFYISNEQSVDVDIEILSDMAMPLCVSGVNLLLPFIFALVARLEGYEKPKHELYINMSRTMLLKAVTLGVLVFWWYKRLQHVCWETFVGQQIYRLVIVDFVFILLSTFFMEFVRRIFKEYCCKTMSYPEFEIGRNTLNLIYSQALCWLGTYFAPMLSLIMIIKLFLLFYVKRFSVINNCRPSLRPWRASRAHTIFLGFLFCFFIMTFAAVACAVIFLTPSTACGPFKGHPTSYDIVLELLDEFKADYSVLHTIIQVISSSGFIAFTLVVLVVLTYYMRIVMVGHKEMVGLLRQQLSMEGRDWNEGKRFFLGYTWANPVEGRDKAYLLKMLQDANRKTRHTTNLRPSGSASRLLSPETAASGTVGSNSPGGRRFIKQLAASGEIRQSDGSPQPGRRGQGGAAGPGTS